MQDEILRRLIQSMNQPMPQLSTEEINLIRSGIPQRGLKETLGAQFTEKEGERLINRVGNQEAPNADYLNYLREQMKTEPAAPNVVPQQYYDSVPSAEELNMLVQFGLLRPMGM